MLASIIERNPEFCRIVQYGRSCLAIGLVIVQIAKCSALIENVSAALLSFFIWCCCYTDTDRTPSDISAE